MKNLAFLERYEIAALQQHFDAKYEEQEEVALETCFVLRLCKQATGLIEQVDSDALLIRDLFEQLIGIRPPHRSLSSVFEEVNRRLDQSWKAYDPQQVGAIKAIIEKREAEKRGATPAPTEDK